MHPLNPAQPIGRIRSVARLALAASVLAAALLAAPGCGLSDRQTQRINGEWRTVYTEYGGRKFYIQQGNKIYLDTLPPAAFQQSGSAVDEFNAP